MKWQGILLLVSFLQVALAAPLSLINYDNVTKPADDPFYTPKPGYEKYNLGDVITYRKITHPIGIIVFPEKVQAAYQFLTRSQDSLGNPTAVVSTVLVPHNADPTKILSYQIAEDAPGVNCAPSYAIQIGSDPSTWISAQIEEFFFESALYEGWTVVLPDHLGPKVSFAAGYQGAHATLDSLKAVLSSGDITGVSQNASVAFWGYSGGSQPTLWSAALAETYAPDINIVGAAAGGLLIDPISIANTSLDSIFAGLIVAAIDGLASEYPDLKTYLKKELYPDVQNQFFSSYNNCMVGIVTQDLYASWDDFSPLGASILDDPIAKNVTSANNLLNLNHTAKVPLFFYNGKHDEIIPASDADKLYTQWCNDGANILYHQDSFSEHITEAFFGAGEAFSWLKDRFNGVPQEGCKKVNSFSNLLSESSLNGFSDLIPDFVLTAFGKQVGPLFPASSGSKSLTSPAKPSTSTHTIPSSSASASAGNQTSSIRPSATSTSSTASSTSTSSSLLGSILGFIF